LVVRRADKVHDALTRCAACGGMTRRPDRRTIVPGSIQGWETDVRYFALVLAAACALTAGPAFAEGALLRKGQPNLSTRVAQRMTCLSAGKECCCERVGPLCCEGLTCTRTIGNKQYCE
jgi:hypothetical protein